MAQVAASALATVVGAVLASELGVYGTILGAAVVSIGATTGGAVFQHLFKRTGEQLRGAVDRTAGPGQLANGLRQAPEPAPAADPPVPAQWSTPRVVRARRRWTWKSYAAVSALVFTLAMVPILAFELATGQPVSATVKGESGTGTSIGGRVDRKPTVPPGDAPSSGPASVPSPSAGGDGGASGRPSPGTRPGSGGDEPSSSPSAGSGAGASTAPSATPSERPGGEPSAPPAPSASGKPSAPSGDGAASTKPSGAATPRPPAPSTAVEPPKPPAPAAPEAPAGSAGSAGSASEQG
ncbi:hypothetical protein ABTX81_35905 [Kitasatospora sp. NPDC097605]|uniref:hypothetical protein n=1 Tax=Kitasatospora sp. NPDC097605 TaxID=3157226 RepID=UPI00332DEF3C